MAIDMSTVKAITHNNKNVKKIEDSNGNVLWSSGPSWHTVFEGSEVLYSDSSHTTGQSKTLATVTGLTGSHTYRITFSNINCTASTYSGTATKTYYTNNSLYSYGTPPTSPIEYTTDFSSNKAYLLSATGSVTYGGSTSSAEVRIRWNASTKEFILVSSWTSGGNVGSKSATITVTKIEVLY